MTELKGTTDEQQVTTSDKQVSIDKIQESKGSTLLPTIDNPVRSRVDTLTLYFNENKDDGDVAITLPITEYTTSKGICRSVSKLMPIGDLLLVAEYGLVGLLEIASGAKNVNVAFKYAVVGAGDEVDLKFPLGTEFIPKMRDNHIMIGVMDHSNQYSLEALYHNARKDSKNSTLFMAVAIAGNKDKSRVGLNIESQFTDKAVLDKAHKLDANKSFGHGLYKDDKMEFVNFRLMHASNVGAIIL